MPTQQFTLIVEGADLQSEAVIDALFEAGCDDATVGRIDRTQYVAFDREAASLGEAILSAVRDVEKVKGIHVTRVEDAVAAPGSDVAVLGLPALASMGQAFAPYESSSVGSSCLVAGASSQDRELLWSGLPKLAGSPPENDSSRESLSRVGSAPTWHTIVTRPRPLRARAAV